MSRSLFVLFALLGAVLPVTAAHAAKSKGEGRTVLERLDMSSPEAAAQSFLDAYGASDYINAYFLLSPEAKQGFNELVGSFNFGALFPGAPAASMPGSKVWGEGQMDDVSFDLQLSTPTAFDDLLYAAEQNDLLPFQLGTPDIGAPTAAVDGVLTLPVGNVGGSPSALTLELTLLSNGQWRVDRVVWDGSDASKRPWAVVP
ncbi:hypothetical protein SAMN05428969_0638 [Devosia sp. YR412]|uniref:hypothetical protein n=1 Tax=Devosia sp. YR412 TaxID=1881030 RepID=UPI0008CC4AC6|nr:hypothetical protein [Devosia sp. YR412]SEP72720.1 hypothetical protein SAMN05428969_0638 [Devosia sp. YR412]